MLPRARIRGLVLQDIELPVEQLDCGLLRWHGGFEVGDLCLALFGQGSRIPRFGDEPVRVVGSS
jgi:hypothetical protein